jgi:four helix bundle protein
MSAFDFKQLDVYKVTIEFMATTEAIVERLPPGHGKLIDQLRRAATSIALNIAEGAGEAQGDEKKRIYRIARRSAFECAAAFDVMRVRRLGDETELRNADRLLERIGAMLTRMTTTPTHPDSDSGAARLDSDSDSGES